MNSKSVDIVMEGKRFSPRLLKESSGLRVKSLTEYDELSTRGRYKGQKSPYGLGTLKVESSNLEDLDSHLDSAIRYLLLEYRILIENGVEEVSLDFDRLADKTINFRKEIFQNLKILNNYLKPHDKIEENQSITAIIIDNNILQLYSSLFLKQSHIEDLPQSKADKLKHLFSKVLESDFSGFKISDSDIIIYLFKYIDEDFDKIPSLQQELKR